MPGRKKALQKISKKVWSLKWSRNQVNFLWAEWEQTWSTCPSSMKGCPNGCVNKNAIWLEAKRNLPRVWPKMCSKQIRKRRRREWLRRKICRTWNGRTKEQGSENGKGTQGCKSQTIATKHFLKDKEPQWFKLRRAQLRGAQIVGSEMSSCSVCVKNR